MIVPPPKKPCGVETRGKKKPFVFQRRLCANWKLQLIQHLRALALPLGCVRRDLFVRRSISPPSLFSSPIRCQGGSGGGESFVQLVALVEVRCWCMSPRWCMSEDAFWCPPWAM